MRFVFVCLFVFKKAKWNFYQNPDNLQEGAGPGSQRSGDAPAVAQPLQDGTGCIPTGLCFGCWCNPASPAGGAAGWEPALGGLCCPQPPCWLPCLWWALAPCRWVRSLEGAASLQSCTDLGEGTGLNTQCSLCQPVSVGTVPQPPRAMLEPQGGHFPGEVRSAHGLAGSDCDSPPPLPRP